MSDRDRCAARGVALAPDFWDGTQIHLEAPDDSAGTRACLRARPLTRFRVAA